jgi:glutamate racemase
MSAVGVFDSGVGGITVLKELKKRWPHENFLYLADTARLPYGTKSSVTIRNYVEQNFRFLLKHDLKAIVVACNSASTAILEEPVPCPIPVFNVIGPGARKAVSVTVSGRIGVLGTRATVASEAYPHAIRRLNKDIQVFQQACPLWVPLVEEGWLKDPVTNLIVYRYVTEVIQKQVDTLILGCTHYPALHDGIRRVTGQSIELVDSSMGLIEDLLAAKICEDRDETPPGRLDMLCTDFSPHLIETFRLLLDGIAYDSLETVHL